MIKLSAAAVLAVSKGIARVAQHSLMNAAHYARKALREQLKKRMEDSLGPSTREILVLTSSALTFMAAFPVPIPAIKDALNFAGEGLGFAALHIPEEAADTYRVEGASAEEIFNTLFDGVRQISRNARENYTGLETELRKLSSEIDDLRMSGLLHPKRPLLTDGADGEYFHHHSSDRYGG